jgi:hypothetical protein
MLCAGEIIVLVTPNSTSELLVADMVTGTGVTPGSTTDGDPVVGIGIKGPSVLNPVPRVKVIGGS